ncbi:hypothetical protein [Lacrimispora brassicae]
MIWKGVNYETANDYRLWLTYHDFSLSKGHIGHGVGIANEVGASYVYVNKVLRRLKDAGGWKTCRAAWEDTGSCGAGIYASGKPGTLLAYTSSKITFESSAEYTEHDSFPVISTCSDEFVDARYIVIGICGWNTEIGGIKERSKKMVLTIEEIKADRLIKRFRKYCCDVREADILIDEIEAAVKEQCLELEQLRSMRGEYNQMKNQILEVLLALQQAGQEIPEQIRNKCSEELAAMHLCHKT